MSNLKNGRLPKKVNFVDFRKAFDRVIREKLGVIMQEYGIFSMYITIIRDLYDLTFYAASSRIAEHQTGSR